MSEKEQFTTTLNGELLRQIKILAINEKCSTNKLIEEAIRNLLEKRKKNPPKLVK
jgi:metal-responsive CopG/Arc/MetJ family transcriptional regulator